MLTGYSQNCGPSEPHGSRNMHADKQLTGKPDGLQPGATLYEVRCRACGALLFVARQVWEHVPVEQAELVILCKQRRGGFKCWQMAPLRKAPLRRNGGTDVRD